MKLPLHPLVAAICLLLVQAQLQAQSVLSEEASMSTEETSPSRQRARDLGIDVGILRPGAINAITDVEGVAAGYLTLREGGHVRTGVTAILPHMGNLYQQKVPAAVYLGNAYGKLAGSTQVQELGNIEAPIILTNTLSVSAGLEGGIRHSLQQPGNEDVRSVNVVVGETNDGGLNDIRGLHITADHVLAAIEAAAAGGPVEEGAVGAGTGTIAFGFKGGIGTSSRRVPEDRGGYTVGVLVQSNYGGILTINGAPVGRELGQFSFSSYTSGESADGSCMIVVATDAPLSPRNLERLAKRAMVGLSRTGSYISNGSGDYVIAFSTAYQIPNSGALEPPVALVSNSAMSVLFLAAAEATEEALYNSMFMAETTTGRDGRTVEALPLDQVREICERYGVLNLQDRLPGAQ